MTRNLTNIHPRRRMNQEPSHTMTTTTPTHHIPPPSSSSTQHPDQYIHQLFHQIKAHQATLPPIIPHRSQSISHHSNQKNHPNQPSSSTHHPSSQSISSFQIITNAFGLLNPTTHPSPSSSSSQTTLNLDPHHLYYLLLSFDRLGLQSIPLDIDLTDPKHSSISKSRIKPYDPIDSIINLDPSHPLINKPASSSSIHPSHTISLFSNLSIRPNTWWSHQSSPSANSSLLNPSSFLFNLLPGRSSTPSVDQQPSIDDQLKYLYSTFTKLPSLCLTPSSNPFNTLIHHHRSSNPILSSSSTLEPMQLLEGFTDLPNQNAIPLSCFKSIWSLYLHDLDPRLFTGWDRISQNLRSLDIRRSGLEDFEAFLVDAIMDDVERERRGKENEIEPTNPPTDQTTTPHPTQTNPSPSTPESSHPPIDSASTPTSLPVGFPTLTWGFLQHLCLADNSLTFLPSAPLKAFKSLSSLDLSSNLLVAVPTGFKDLPRLKLLNLSDNMIDSVLGIYHSLNSVTTVNLSRNRLSSLCGLERLTTLERLDIRSNQIHDIRELSRLAVLPKLTSLWTSENPFCIATAHHQTPWRIEIFNYFSSENREIDYRSDLLIHLTLDNQTPTYSERKLIKKPLRRSSTPELSLASGHSRKTLVRSPEKKTFHHPPRLKKLEDPHDLRATCLQTDSSSPHPLDSSGSTSSIVVEGSLPSSSPGAISIAKRVGSFKKKDKPSRKKMTRIVELQNNRSSSLESSSFIDLKRGNEAGHQSGRLIKDLDDHFQSHHSGVSSVVGSVSSISSSSRLSTDRTPSFAGPSSNPARDQAKLLPSTSTGQQPKQELWEQTRSTSPSTTASLHSPDPPRAHLDDRGVFTTSSSTRPLPASDTHLFSSSPPPPHSQSHHPLHLPPRSDSDHDGLKLRQRIEALKVELGEEAWLKVLGESDFG